MLFQLCYSYCLTKKLKSKQHIFIYNSLFKLKFIFFYKAFL